MLWTRRFAFVRAVARISLRELIACVALSAVGSAGNPSSLADDKPKPVAPPRIVPADKTSRSGEPKPNDGAGQAAKIAGADWPKLRADLIHLGRKSDAIASGEAAVAASRRTYGDVSEQVATDLVWLGTFYVDQDDLEAARRVCKEALAIRVKLLGEKHDLTSDARRELADVDLRSRLTPAERRELIEADHEHQTAADRTAPDASALKSAHRSLNIRRRLLGSEHPLVASSLNVLGEIEKESHQFRQAESDLKQALTIRQKRLGNDHPQTLETQIDLAFVYEDWGRYPRSAQIFQQVLATRRRLLGEEHCLTGDAYSGLGFSYMLLGDFAKARPAMTRALEILQKTRGEEHSLTCQAAINLGRLYIRVNDDAKAEPVFQKILAIEQRVRPGGFQAARAMDGLVDCCLMRRDFAHAEQICRDSLAIKRRVLGDSHPDVHVTLHLLGQVYWSERRYVEARQTFETTLKFARQALGSDHIFVANLLCMLGKVAHDMHDDVHATQCFTEELQVTRRLYHGDHPTTARALYDLGSNQYCRGESQKAASLLNDALNMSRNVLRENFGVLAEREQFALQSQMRRYLDEYLSATDAVAARPAEVYRHLLASKGAVTADQWLSRLERGRPELVPVTERLRGVGARLARASFATPDRSRRESWLKDISDLTEQKERLEQELANKSAAFREHKQAAQLDPDALRSILPKGTALVDILLYSHSFPRKPDEKTRRKAELRAVAFVVRRDAEIRRIELGPFEPIFQSMKTWHETYGASQGSVDPGHDLRERIWKPLAPSLNGAETVFVSPDGSFCSFPLAALPGSKPDMYLIEERNIVLVPVPQLLLQPHLARPDSKVAAQSGFDAPLLVGNVDFDAGSHALPASALAARGEAAHGLFSPLPGSGKEVVEVGDAYRRAFKREPITLTGTGASQQAVRTAAERHRWLHFATHGFSTAGNPAATDRSKTARGRANGNLIASVEEARGFYPDLLSGIALSGANRGWGSSGHRSSAGADDGLLTALEVEELDLSGTELVVLSACETGLGRLAAGEGTLGLQRAFQIAGAKNVVASLWTIDDEATVALMQLFYHKLWDEKKPPAVALREAQLFLLHHPEQIKSLATRGPNFSKLTDLPDAGTVPQIRLTASPRLWAAFVIAGPGSLRETN
jgi:CHAT domain-containing protein/tetratricopeptide (TPR) repeat protein